MNGEPDPTLRDRLERDRREAIVRSIQDGLIVLDRDGVVLEVNDRWSEILGFASEEAVGRTPPFPWWPDDEAERSRLQEVVGKVVVAGERGEFNVRYRRKDGRHVDVVLSATPLFHPTTHERLGSVGTIKERHAEGATHRLQILVAVSRALAAAVTLEDVVDGTVASLRGSMDLEAIGLALREGRKVRMAATHGDDPLFPSVASTVPSTSPFGRVAATGDVLVLDSGTATKVPASIPARIRIVVPIRARERIVGVLGVAISDRNFGPIDVDLMEQVATRVGTNLERARLFEAESVARAAADRARSRVERLQSSTAELAKSAEVDEVTRIVLREAIGIVHAHAGGLVLPNTDGSELRFVAREGFTVDLAPVSLPVGSSFAVCETFRTGSIVLIPNRLEWEERYPEGAGLFEGHARSQISVPVLGAERPLGAIALLFRDERTPSDEDLKMLMSLSEQATVALERANARDRERSAAERLARIQEITAALSAATNPSEVAEAVLRAGLPGLGATAGALLLVADDGEALELVTYEGYPQALMRDFSTIPVDADLPLAEAVRTGEMIFLVSQDEADERYPRLAERRRSGGSTANRGARLAIPLTSGGYPIGGLAISFEEVRTLSEQERRTWITIGSLVSQALDRARLYATEHRVAQVLQESLLPQAQRSVGPARVAARYLAAATDASVGGDWFEIVDLADDRIGIAVGDVVGNGIVAATAMGQLRSALRALALAGKRPAEILSALDDFAETTEGAVMSTAAYAEFDTRTGAITYACAGHPPPLVVGPSGPRFLEGGRRTPLAVEPSNPTSPEETADRLDAGDTVILYTDGLIERRGESLDAGLDRLAEVAAELSDRGPDTLAERLVEHLLPEGSTQDDAAVLCLRFEPTDWRSLAEHGPTTFEYRFTAAPEALAKLRVSLRGWLGANGLDREVVEEIVLAIGEACANAIEHGQLEDPGVVVVTIDLEEGTLVATVTDTGTWRAGSASTSRGRGIPLMRVLMDDVEIRPAGEGTTVIMRRAMHRPPVRPLDDLPAL